jgi:hypothetical protein
MSGDVVQMTQRPLVADSVSNFSRDDIMEL